MKKWTVLLFLAMFGLAACSKRSARNDNVTTAGVTTGFNTNCLTTNVNGTCGFNTIGNAGNGFFQQYPTQNGYYNGYNNNFQSGFNQCPPGSVPSYNSGYGGLACVPLNYLQGYGQQQFALWQWNPVNYNFNFYGYHDYYSLQNMYSSYYDPYLVMHHVPSGYGGGCGGYGGYMDYGSYNDISFCGNINFSFGNGGYGGGYGY